MPTTLRVLNLHVQSDGAIGVDCERTTDGKIDGRTRLQIAAGDLDVSGLLKAAQALVDEDVAAVAHVAPTHWTNALHQRRELDGELSRRRQEVIRLEQAREVSESAAATAAKARVEAEEAARDAEAARVDAEASAREADTARVQAEAQAAMHVETAWAAIVLRDAAVEEAAKAVAAREAGE
jgi:adhesin HecA-like repeat protein